MERRVELAAGTLTLSIDASDLEFDDLCGFASRRNRRRGFLFVSKVLGKHFPVRPAAMEDAYLRLANKLPAAPSPLFVGLAETATGLAHGVYEQYVRRRGVADSLFIHTTRHRFRRPQAIEFREPHSHAPEHLLYLPEHDEHRALFETAKTAVLIDDELSTGTTLSNLAVALRRRTPDISQLHIVSLKNWLGPQARDEFRRRVGVPTAFHSLVHGTYDFQPNLEYEPSPPADGPDDDVFMDRLMPHNYGRFGVQKPLNIPFDVRQLTSDLNPGARVLVLGTGEFNYPPYLLARALAAEEFDVRFQSTTRSPIAVGADIRNVCEFADHHYAGNSNYLYNVVDRSYDRILICYEIDPPSPAHRLNALVGGVPLLFSGAGPTPMARPN